MFERHVQMSGRLFFLTGKMPERHVKICGRHHVFFSGKMSERYVKMSERHVKVSERQFGDFFRQDVCVPC